MTQLPEHRATSKWDILHLSAGNGVVEMCKHGVKVYSIFQKWLKVTITGYSFETGGSNKNTCESHLLFLEMFSQTKTIDYETMMINGGNWWILTPQQIELPCWAITFSQMLQCVKMCIESFCTVLYGVVVFVFADFSANKLQQHQDSNTMSPTDTSQEIWDTCSGLGPQLFRWMQPESDSRYNVFSSCPCFPGSFLSYHSCIWPCSRTDSPLAAEKCCFWNLVLSIQAD